MITFSHHSQSELLYEDVSGVLLDGGGVVNRQTLRQPFALYLLHRVEAQDVQRAGHRAEHLKHLKHASRSVRSSDSSPTV